MCDIGKFKEMKKDTLLFAWKVFIKQGDMLRSIYKRTSISYDRKTVYYAKHRNGSTVVTPSIPALPTDHSYWYHHLTGFWAFKTREQARQFRRSSVSRRSSIVRVALFGNVAVHERGYRAAAMILKEEKGK